MSLDISPFGFISELPELTQRVQNVYKRLLAEKRGEVADEIQAARAEIHQAADAKQQDIVTRADNALDEKAQTAEKAEKLVMLDAMKIQIANVRQQYMQRLAVVAEPNVKSVTVSRGNICGVAKLKTESDIDEYLAEIKEKLMQRLDGNDVLNII